MPPSLNALVEVFNKVRIIGDCWAYGNLEAKGYPALKINGIKYDLHRLVFCMLNNEDLKGTFFVCHSCDFKRCINPFHLFKGTSQDNVVDAVRKGIIIPPKYIRKGQEAVNARFSDEQVLMMKRARVRLGLSYAEIARIFNLNGHRDAWGIVNDSWCHLDALI